MQMPLYLVWLLFASGSMWLTTSAKSSPGEKPCWFTLFSRGHSHADLSSNMQHSHHYANITNFM